MCLIFISPNLFDDRWLIPPYPRALNITKFCKTKEDFNLIYGLSLEGIDPVVLTDKLISDIDWFFIYKLPKVKGKVKLKDCTTIVVWRLHKAPPKITSRDPGQQRILGCIRHSLCLRVLQNNEGSK